LFFLFGAVNEKEKGFNNEICIFLRQLTSTRIIHVPTAAARHHILNDIR